GRLLALRGGDQGDQAEEGECGDDDLVQELRALHGRYWAFGQAAYQGCNRPSRPFQAPSIAAPSARGANKNPQPGWLPGCGSEHGTTGCRCEFCSRCGTA